MTLMQRFDLAAAARESGIRRKEIILRPIEPRRATEVELQRVLTRMVAGIYARARSDILPRVNAERSVLALDSISDRLGSLFGAFRQAVERLLGGVQGLAQGLLEKEAARHTERFREAASAATGVDLRMVLRPADVGEVVEIAAKRSAIAISGLAADVVKKVEQAALTSLVGGVQKPLEQQLEEDQDAAKRRSKLIAQDQVIQLVAVLNRTRQTQAGVEQYVWATRRDERVRRTHQANEGRIFRWDSAPPTGHPGTAPNCRCRALAILKIENGTVTIKPTVYRSV